MTSSTVDSLFAAALSRAASMDGQSAPNRNERRACRREGMRHAGAEVFAPLRGELQGAFRRQCPEHRMGSIGRAPRASPGQFWLKRRRNSPRREPLGQRCRAGGPKRRNEPRLHLPRHRRIGKNGDGERLRHRGAALVATGHSHNVVPTSRGWPPANRRAEAAT